MIALYTGVRHAERLAGIVALSTYVVLPDRLADEGSAANRDVPIFMAHGTSDPMIRLEWGDAGRRALVAAGYSGRMAHVSDAALGRVGGDRGGERVPDSACWPEAASVRASVLSVSAGLFFGTMPRRASASRSRNSISAFMLRSSACARRRMAVHTPGSTRSRKAFLSAMANRETEGARPASAGAARGVRRDQRRAR